jgi:hypothetical protein
LSTEPGLDLDFPVEHNHLPEFPLQ